ncbi:hypothetical protein HK100_008563, partial [Physocladia obscura]
MRNVYDSAEVFFEVAESYVERGFGRVAAASVAGNGGANDAEPIGMIPDDWDGKTFTMNVKFLEQPYRVHVPLMFYPEEIGDVS